MLTLGFSRRSLFCAFPNERLSQFLEAHERAFEHFGGHTREHLYDRPRPLRLLPTGATVAGRDLHPPGNGALNTGH